MLLKSRQNVTKPKSRVATPGRRRGAVKPGHHRPFLEVLEDRRLPSVSLTGVPSWIERGPGPITGSGHTVAFPNNTAVGAVESIVTGRSSTTGSIVAYAGTVNGGIWRSDNLTAPDPATISWRPLTDQQPSLATTCMALNPLDSTQNTVFVGTGSFSSAGSDGGRRVGLLRTTDGGATWTVLSQLAGQRVLSIVPTLITQSMGQVVLVASDEGGLLRSVDGGNSFQPVNNNDTFGLLTGSATDLVRDNNNNLRFYAALPNQGVYQSNNGGANWFAISSGIPVIAGSGNIRLAVHTDNSGTVLYAGLTDSHNVLTGVYRAVTNIGQPTWSAVSPSTLASVVIRPDPIHIYSPGLGDFTMTADPSSATVVYIGALYRGDAAGNQGLGSWTSLVGGPTNGTSPHEDTRQVSFLNDTTFLETDDGGIYSLVNPRFAGTPGYAGRWVSLVGNLRVTEFFSVAFDARSGSIFGGAQDTGNPASPDNLAGGAWSERGLGGDGGFVAVDNSGATALHYFMSAGPGAFFRANPVASSVQLANTPGGALFSGLNAADKALTNGADYSPFPFVLNAANPKRMLLANYGLYESRLVAGRLPLPTGDVIDDISPPYSGGYFVVPAYGALNNPDVIYVGTSTGDLFSRVAAGTTFFTLSTPWRDEASVRRIVIDQVDYHIAYILDTSSRIWRTTNAGAAGSWTELTDNLGDVTKAVAGFTDLRTIELYDPTPGSQPGDDVILAGGLGGVYRLLGPAGRGWTQYGTAFPNVLVTDLHSTGFGLFNNFLLAGTLGRGAWTVGSNDVTTPGSLQVNGDDGGDTTDDTIVLRLDPANPKFIQAVVNGRVQYDGAYAPLGSITINGRLGHDLISIEDIPSNIAVTTIEGDTGMVNVGKAGSVQGIRGSLTVTNPPRYTALNVDDSADTTGRTVTITNAAITGLAPGIISYQQNDLSGLSIQAGSAGSISSGSTFAVQATPNHGASGTVTTTLSSRGRDTVNVGGGLFGVHVQGIVGNLTISNPANFTTLIADDSGDSTGRTVTITNAAIIGLAPGVINYGAGVNSLVIHGGKGGAQFSVISTRAGVATTLDSHAGNDTILVSPEVHNLDAIQGALTINGATGPNTLVVNDQANPHQFRYFHQLTLTDSNLTRVASSLQFPLSFVASIDYHNIRTLVVHAGPWSELIDINSTAGGTETTVDAGDGTNTITVSPQAHNLDAIAGSLTINGGAGANGLTVNDQANPNFVFNSLVLTAANLNLTRVTFGFGTGIQVPIAKVASINYQNMKTLAVHAGPWGNQIDINSTNLGTETAIDAGDGTNTITVSPQAHNLDAIAGPLTINGGAGANGLTVNDQANPHQFRYFHQLTLTDSNLTRVASSLQFPLSFVASIDYHNLRTLLVHASPWGKLVDINSTAGGTETTVDAGDGTNTITVSPQAHNLDAIQGPLTINGGTGANTLTVNDQGTATARTLTIASTFVNRFGAAPISWTGVQGVTVNGGSGGNTISVATTGVPLTVNAGNGNDTIAVGGATGLTSIRGDLTVNGQAGTDVLTLNDQVNLGQTYEVTSNRVSRPGAFGPAPVFYNTVESLVLNTASGTFAGIIRGNLINVLSTHLGTATTVNGGIGNDTINVGNSANRLDDIQGPLTVNGQAGTATLTINDSGDATGRQATFNNDGFDYGVSGLAGPVGAPTRIYWEVSTNATLNVQVRGGSGNDTFRLQSVPPSIRLAIDGGGGTNALDYSAYTSNVLVDLPLGSATAVGGGIANIQNVTGASGGPAGSYNILVGNGGNVLSGGNGRRNLLIAGARASTLLGGDDQDILIGGTTVYDRDPTSLQAIMAYWTGPDSYATRVANLRSGIGVPLLNATKVTGNGGRNTLTGRLGLDLFYGNLELDTYDWDPLTETFVVL